MRMTPLESFLNPINLRNLTTPPGKNSHRMYPRRTTRSKQLYLNLIFGENCCTKEFFTGSGLSIGLSYRTFLSRTSHIGLPVKNQSYAGCAGQEDRGAL